MSPTLRSGKGRYGQRPAARLINTNNVHNPDVTLLMTDGKYTVSDRSSFINVLNNFWERQKNYVRDRYDCENFAEWFRVWLVGLGITAVGVVYDSSPVGQQGHAYNMVIFENPDGTLEAHLLEPQTGGFVNKGSQPVPGVQGHYELLSGLVIL